MDDWERRPDRCDAMRQRITPQTPRSTPRNDSAALSTGLEPVSVFLAFFLPSLCLLLDLLLASSADYSWSATNLYASRLTALTARLAARVTVLFAEVRAVLARFIVCRSSSGARGEERLEADCQSCARSGLRHMAHPIMASLSDRTFHGRLVVRYWSAHPLSAVKVHKPCTPPGCARRTCSR